MTPTTGCFLGGKWVTGFERVEVPLRECKKMYVCLNRCDSLAGAGRDQEVMDLLTYCKSVQFLDGVEPTLLFPLRSQVLAPTGLVSKFWSPMLPIWKEELVGTHPSTKKRTSPTDLNFISTEPGGVDLANDDPFLPTMSSL